MCCIFVVPFSRFRFGRKRRFTSFVPELVGSAAMRKIHQTDGLLPIKNMVMSINHHKPLVNQL